MGICVTKRDRESADLLAGTLLSNPSPAAIQELINLREDNTTQTISLVGDSSNLRKLDARKVMERLVRLRENN
jgi:hypothetical protein